LSGIFGGGKPPKVERGNMPDLNDAMSLAARRSGEAAARNRQGRMSTFLSDALKKLSSAPTRTN
jgi:hypothetical protein